MSPIPPVRIRLGPALLALAALALAFAGQWQFDESPDPTLGAVLTFVLAAGCLFAAEWLVKHPAPAATETTHQGTAEAWQWAMTGIALALTGWVTWILLDYPRGQGDDVPVLPWLMSWLLLLVTWLPLPQVADVRRWLAAHRSDLLLLCLLTLAAALLRLWKLGSLPYALSGDEGSIGIEVQRVLQGELRNPFTLGWGPLPTLSFFVQAVPAWLLGLNAWTLRLMNALFAILAIPMLYLLARLLCDQRTALAAALLLAGYHVHLHYSRATINVIFDTFFYPAAVFALLYGLRRASSPAAFVLGGLLAGFAQYSNVGARLLPIMIIAFLLYLLAFQRSWLRGQRDNLLVLLISFVVVSAPMMVYAWQRPDDYNTRINQIGIVQSGWLEREQQTRGTGPLPVLAEQFYRTLLGFGVYDDRTVSYGGGTLASPAMAVLLFLGLGLATVRWRQPVYALLLLWFWGGLIGGGVLTTDPPTSNRLVMLTPVVALFAGLALAEVVRLLLLALGPRLSQRWKLAAVCVLALPLLFQDVRHYFRDYLPRQEFGSSHAYIATELGYYLAARSPSPHLYFFGPPRMWSGFSSLVFLAPDAARTDVSDPITIRAEVESLVEPGNDALFVFLPERGSELDVVRERFPEGTQVEFYHPTTGELLFLTYQVARDELS